MSAVMKPPGGGIPSDPPFPDSQQPSDKQDKSFEALFVRQLKQVVLLIHETENVEQIMLEVSPEICKLFNADRLTLYAIGDDETSIVSKIKTGLAVTGPRRSGALPEVPTIAEAGLPEAQFEYWSGIVAPAGTPRRIVEQLHGDVVRALRRPDVREQFARQGAEPTADSTPAAFMQLMRTDLLRYQAIIREADIRPQ